jgi:hypothetical protein
MALLTEAVHTARIPLPHLIVRGKDTTLSCPLYLSGALVSAVSGTVTIYKDDGTALVTDAACTITANIATYVVTAASTTSLELADGWLVTWAITIAGSVVINARSDAALVRTGLLPVISDVDIARRVPGLDPAGASALTRATHFQDAIDEAWVIIENRLIANGKRPWLVLSPSSLREVHMSLTLMLIYRDQRNRNPNAYDQAASEAERAYDAAWNSLVFRYDENDDQTVPTTGRAAGPSTVWLV